MANIVITRSNDIMHILYNAATLTYSEYATNMITGMRIGRLADDDGVLTNILCMTDMTYDHTMFTTIGGVSITSNQILFDELKKMLSQYIVD